MPTPTKTLETKGGHTVVLKEYLTARERRAINAVIFDKVSFTIEDKKAKMGEVPASVSSAIEDETIRQIVVSVDGKTDNILEAILDLPEKDFDEINATIGAIAETEQKKTV